MGTFASLVLCAHAAHVKYDPEDRLLLALLDEAQRGASQGGYVASPSPETGAGVMQRLATSAMGANNGAGAVRSLSSNNGGSRSGTERVVRGMRRFVLRKDQAALEEDWRGRIGCGCGVPKGEDNPPTVRWDDGNHGVFH